MLIRSTTAVRRTPIVEGWTFAGASAGAVREPGPALDALEFGPAPVPGTVAQALSLSGNFDLSHPPPLDERDYFYRCALPRGHDDARQFLVFDGLATLAEAWIGRTRVHASDNMFRRREVDVTEVLAREDPVLSLRFRALGPELAARKPRPLWRTRIVDHQQLRWFRTTLIGRTPGFCPAVPPVGPYREVRLESRRRWSELDASFQPEVDVDGTVKIRVRVDVRGGREVPRAVRARVDGPAGIAEVDLALDGSGDAARAIGVLAVPNAALWWPSTHGAQPLTTATLEVGFSDGVEIVDLGRIGFRRLERAPGDGFDLRVNGVPVFCRGACWTAEDVLAPGGPGGARQTLELAREAGINMIRVGGTTLYESDAFYDACDELGILVWQDFMFANMDYPAQDAEFVSEVRAEGEDVLSRLEGRPCLAVLCGGSEIEQQAAMLGLPPDSGQGPLVTEILPELVGRLAPDAAYLPSTPTGGVLPFHTSTGVTHYYGVGAYLRPFSDVRSSGVRFAAECLAFANVPEQRSIDRLMQNLESPPQHPRWKERVPRDRGVGWDFEDVRDHYVATLFGVDPALVRRADGDRYLALGRVATGEVMERVFAEWRRPSSPCGGGLVFWLKDFWLGAGWGVIDADGVPKAAYYALKRAFAPVALLVTDEGLEGYMLHAVNDTDAPVEAELDVRLYRHGRTEVARGSRSVDVPERRGVSLSVDALLGRFHDVNHVYRFGPPTCDLMGAWLRRKSDGAVLGRAFAAPLGWSPERHDDLGLEARFAPGDERTLLVKTARFALAVCCEVPGFALSDNYFCLAPGEERAVTLRPLGAEARSPEGWVQALNDAGTLRVRRAGG